MSLLGAFPRPEGTASVNLRYALAAACGRTLPPLSSCPPWGAGDYISRRALRPDCGQLTGLVIGCESGREGRPQQPLRLVLAPHPGPCTCRWLRVDPGCPLPWVASLEGRDCAGGESFPLSPRFPSQDWRSIGRLSARFSPLASSLRTVRGFEWRRRGDCPGPLLASEQAEPKCPRNLKSFSTSLF